MRKVHVEPHENSDMNDDCQSILSIESKISYLNIHERDYDPNNPHLFLNLGNKWVNSLGVYNLENLTQIELSENSIRDNFDLRIYDCPNINVLPKLTSKLTIRGNCDINRLFDGTIIYQNLKYLCIMDNVSESKHIFFKSLPALKHLCIYKCNYEEINLYTLSDNVEILPDIPNILSITDTMDIHDIYKLNVHIALCTHLNKITHVDNTFGKIKLCVYIIDSYVPTILPPHTYKVVLEYTFENRRKRKMLMEQFRISKIRLPKYLKILNVNNGLFGEPVYFPLANIHMPEYLEYVFLQKCIIDDASNFTDTLKILKCSDCRFGNFALDNLPNSLEKMYFSHCVLGNFAAYPKFLKHLTVLRCELVKISVPDGLLSLNCEFNFITNIDDLPDSLENLECGGNPISIIKRLPTNMKYFSYNNDRGTYRTIRIYNFSPNVQFSAYFVSLERGLEPPCLPYYNFLNYLRDAIRKKLCRNQTISP